jgi:hypothetical protein
MIVTKDSHLDHALTVAQLHFLLVHFEARDAFFIETIQLPLDLGTVPSALYGPAAGDAPVDERDVTYEVRGDRPWTSRMVARPLRQTRTLTVIAGPHEGHPCVLYTVYGGPQAPQEPGDPNCRDVEAAKRFWSEHGLGRI